MDGLTAIPVFFDPRMVAAAQSFSPSAGKPAAAVDSWKRLGIPLEIHAFRPVTVEQLSLAHDPGMVRKILAGQMENGFGNTLDSVTASLPFTSGAMLAAARAALEHRSVAVAPVSGFHHAGYDFCGGYCTFNGLIVTAQVLLEDQTVRKIGILDFDQHHGNGTEDCILRLRLADRVRHLSASPLYRRPDQAETFLARIPSLLEEMQDCDVVLYQAGADPHIDDPPGGWLTGEQLADRDRAVFDAALRLRLPIAWNLAGGYQDPIGKVLAIHDATLKACAYVFLRR